MHGYVSRYPHSISIVFSKLWEIALCTMSERTSLIDLKICLLTLLTTSWSGSVSTEPLTHLQSLSNSNISWLLIASHSHGSKSCSPSYSNSFESSQPMVSKALQCLRHFVRHSYSFSEKLPLTRKLECSCLFLIAWLAWQWSPDVLVVVLVARICTGTMVAWRAISDELKWTLLGVWRKWSLQPH